MVSACENLATYNRAVCTLHSCLACSWYLDCMYAHQQSTDKADAKQSVRQLVLHRGSTSMMKRQPMLTGLIGFEL